MTTTFPSGNKQITLDVFTPAKAGKHPIVIALHGSGGAWNSGHGSFPQLLADRGFAVFLPHFFESTGTSWATPETLHLHFAAWMITVSDAINFAAGHPAADASKIGIIGFSLGAYLGLSLASQQPRINAVVDFFGGLPDHFAERLQHLPPVLILHGERDNRVPVSEAHKLEALLKQQQSPYEIKIYPNAGHGFSGFDMLDAGQRAYFFLKKYLG